ncbi:MAG: glycosyltransferase [Sulfuricella sp.]|nr:glycosyltransferase [Sulfuricella sp.]
MNAAPWLEIFVLCHNRPESAKNAIQSILDQRAGGFRLIVSDNSSDDRVAEMMRANFPSVQLVRRPRLPALEHFNTCIAEARAEYFCLFHDDDMMGPDFVGEMRTAADRFPDAVAFGANAWEVNQAAGLRTRCFQAFGRYAAIDSAKALFRRYFGRHQTGIAPFPGYVYRTAVAGAQRIPVDGGKYADVSWLLRLASLGTIVWRARPLMEYHLHGENDGLQESRRDRLRFLGLIKHCRQYAGQAGLGDYRYFIYKKIVAADGENPHKQARIRRLRQFLMLQRLRRALRLTDYAAMLHKTLLKNLKHGRDQQ